MGICAAMDQTPSPEMKRGGEHRLDVEHFYSDVMRLTELSIASKGTNHMLAATEIIGMLADMMALDFAALRFDDAATPVTFTGQQHLTPDDSRLLAAMASDLPVDPQSWPATVPLTEGDFRLAMSPLFRITGQGLLFAASRRADFPTEAERVRLTIAADQIFLATHATLGTERSVNDRLSLQKSGRTGNDLSTNLVLNSIPAMVWSAGSDGKLDYCNEQLLSFVGLPLDDLRGDSFFAILHPDDLQRIRANWDEVFHTRKPHEVVGRIKRVDGTYKSHIFRQSAVFDDECRVIRWLGVLVELEDSTTSEMAIHETHAALMASERNLQEIISSIPGHVWAADTTGATNFYSDSYLAYFGQRREDVMGFEFLKLIHPDDLERTLSVYSHLLSSGIAGEAEIRMRRADGVYRWFLIRTSPFFDAAGNLTQWFGVNIEIDDRKHAEEKLHQSQSDLAHVARMTTMGELAVSIAHEVNQPLMSIVTSASTCLRWLSDPQPEIELAKQAARRIVRDGHRAADIIASVRALSRKAAPVMRPVHLQSVITDVLELLRGEMLRHNVALSTAFEENIPQILGDQTQLQQVILNLVMNAADAMAGMDRKGRHVSVQVFSSGDHVQVSIGDSGIGLMADQAEQVFEAFFTTKPEGIGMGLSICRSIVEAHGGTIWASPNFPQGSVFSFTIPLANGDQTGGAAN